MASRTRSTGLPQRFAAVPLVTVLAASTLLLVLASAALGGFTLQALVATAAAAALVATLGRTAHVPVRVHAVRARPGSRREHVDAPTAYWCSVDAPSRPQRPRAPGRR
ncbi:hypothetical protein [Terrabacter sp. 2RAF25]|uniref:hypothetical protein n=1 Tax=Terrabacter sp. 2RAF25 TaxID=3232998 RepID=UPI003F9E3ACD